ncbi:NitT/TauT family transport system permease protein [Nocardia transvalensis]|uniref:NitT/TauT family transport system permease protein n=1 Tax=Nocardia transvalensis TaxID=37333 RepID=A0A7W9UM88_9NOCA|nr:ABC transporter permease [Nocardia transvalensis]MBB5918364.1 NitT/TauT family transport system permease protein [Nocardia transvalensis]
MTRADAPAQPGTGTATAAPTEQAPRVVARYRSRALSLLWALPVPALLILLWDRGVHGGWTLPLGIQMRYLPTPLEVARRLADLGFGGLIDDTYSGTLWLHLYASTVRVVQGFALAALIAVPLGIVMGRSRLVYRMVEPTINLIRPIPVTAWAPLSLLIIGFGDRSTIFLVFLAAVFAILLNTIAGVQAVPPRLFEAAAMLGTRPAQTLYKVVLPAAVPGIVSGLRIALGLSWVILVVGETVGIRVGLGALITQAREQSRTDLIVAVMIVIGLAGFLADRVLLLAVRMLVRRRPLLPAAT